jgi:hypothetical protein
MPYVYKIMSKTTKEYYIGLRYSENAKSFDSDFFIRYFTSSKLVHSHIKKY